MKNNFIYNIPASPVLSWSTFVGFCRIPSIASITDIHWLTSGRAATAIALQEMAIRPSDKVLLPALHSVSMLAPVQWLGANYEFYRIKSDTSIDMDDLESRIDGQTRLIVAAHFFGFPQPSLNILSELCLQKGLFLLEDCAHAFYGQVADQPLGHFGDYAIASPMKFFPVFDGGCLWSSKNKITLKKKQNSLKFEVKSALNILERGLEWGRLPPLQFFLKPPLWLKDMLWKILKSRHLVSQVESSPASEGGTEFDPSWNLNAMTIASRLVLHTLSHDRVAAHRRTHYLRLLETVNQLEGCKPLHHDLPHGVVPYLFPLLLDDPDRILSAFRHEGIPILRFAENIPKQAARICPISADFSRRLIQLPCHQEMRTHEVDWLIKTLYKIFRGS